MPLAATSLAAKPLDALAHLLASSATFQGEVGAASETEGLDSIHWPEADDRQDADGNLSQPRPRAIVRLAPEHTLRRLGPGNWHDGGVLELTLELPIPDAYRGQDGPSRRDAYTWFTNTYGEVLAEMKANRDDDQAGAYLAVNDFVSIEGPDQLDPDEDEEHIYAITWLVFWGSVRP